MASVSFEDTQRFVVMSHAKLYDCESDHGLCFDIVVYAQQGESFIETITRLIVLASAPINQCQFGLGFGDLFSVLSRFKDRLTLSDQVFGAFLRIHNLIFAADIPRQHSGA